MSNKMKLNIVFYVNGMTFDGNSLKTHSLGGSETAGLCMARELAKRGHDITMFCNTKNPGKVDNVNYIPIEHFSPYMAYTATDVLIAQRVPQIFTSPMKSKINILWQHDVGLKRMRTDFMGSLWNVAEVWGLSDFHIKQMSETYGVSEDLFWKTRNGIDPIRLTPQKRNPKRLIYTARPERGMDVLLRDIMPKIWAQDPAMELHLCGYDNTVPEMVQFYDSLHAMINDYQKKGLKIKWLGALTKKELYKEYQRASLFVYPTEFEEISCITAMECMACGLPMIGSKLAALPETIADGAGILLDGNNKSEEYQEKFIKTVFDVLNNPEQLKQMRQAGLDAAGKLAWSDVAVEWESHFYEMFEKLTENKETLAKHLYRNEDIITLKEIASPTWKEKIDKEYPLLHSTESYNDMYNLQGHTVPPLEKLNEYTRVKVVMNLLADYEPFNLLDYGGGIGNEAIQFVNTFGCQVTTADISLSQQDVGKRMADRLCTAPEKITWKICDQPKDLKFSYDAVFAGEILEHQIKPWDFVDALEKQCDEGGLLIFTVPLGPWGDVEGLEYRGHLWNFEKSDLRDMFGNKKDLMIKMVAGPANEKNGETLGWYVIAYKKNSKIPTGKIDMQRKISIQAPRQTISTCMIIGGKQEGLLHRCLDSILLISDEIIIADTGMNRTCLEIIQSPKYQGRIKVLPNSPDPLKDGFNKARNHVISKAKCDWILWIDSDEELLTPVNLFKYLRENIYQGYSIKQHHFSAQPPNAFKPDIPIRLFRNHKGIKFFGVVHEHPEKSLNEGVGVSTLLSDVDIAHDGYLTETGRRKRFNRNFQLLLRDREKYPDRELGKFLIMRDWILLSRYELEMNGGKLTPQIEKNCRAVVKMYQDEFLGKKGLMSADGLQFYSEALEFLREGFSYIFNLNVHPQKAQIAGDDTTARFATKDDFITFMKANLDTLKEPFDGRYI